jgi:hypothetical protein
MNAERRRWAEAHVEAKESRGGVLDSGATLDQSFCARQSPSIVPLRRLPVTANRRRAAKNATCGVNSLTRL